MADIIENNSPMQEAPLVNTNEPIVEQPMVEPEGGEGDPVKKGGTSTKKDTTPKYDLDNGQLNTTAAETNKKLAEFSAMVFKTTGVAPTYKGKPITDLSTISTLVDKDGKAAQQLYQQATAALESPDLDEDSIASLYTKVYEIESGFNRTAAIKQQISKNKRIDLPTVGLNTFKQCKKVGINGIVLKHKQNIYFILVAILTCVAIYYFKDLSIALGQTEKISLILSFKY